LFYNRDSDSLPRSWISKMKDAIRLNCPFFNTERMVSEYAIRAYFPASDRYHSLSVDHYAPAHELAQWKANLSERWYNIKIASVDISDTADLKVNQTITVKAKIDLATINPDDIQVQLYQGAIDTNGEIVDGISVVMKCQEQDSNGSSVYTAELVYTHSGLQGLSLRVLPQNEYLSSPYEPRLILWAS
jgi:glycogen phosphorylase